MPSSAVSKAIAAERADDKKRTYDEQGKYQDDHDDDNDGDGSENKNNVSGLAAFFHYARAHHKQVRTILMGGNDPTAKTMAANVAFGKVAEELAKKYKALPATIIADYEEEAVKSDVDFVEEMKPFSVPTRTRKKKDPDAPKGPVSSYFHYMMATRTTIAAENPDMGFGAVTKECAKRFKDLKDEDRKQWEEKAVADKIRYKEQMEVFEKEQEAKQKTKEKTEDENDDDHEKATKPNKKSKKNPEGKEKTQENAGNEKEDPAKEADRPKTKNKRKTLTEEQKTEEKQDDKPNKAKKSHTKEHDKGEGHESAGNEKDDTPKEKDKPKKSKSKTLTGEQKTEEKEDDHAKAEKPKKKEKRPADAPTWYKSGYTLYMEANRGTIQKDNPGMAHSEVSKLGSTNFKALPASEQQMWMIQATADKARFVREMEVYNKKQEGAKKDE